MSARLGATVATALFLLAWLAPAALAAPPRPIDLQVTGGGEWRPETGFGLQWTNPEVGGGTPLARAHCRVRDPGGTAVFETHLSWVSEAIAAVHVPEIPGAYTAEVWLEDRAGEEGQAATVTLRFDDRRPAAIALPEVPAWIGRTAFPLTVHLGPPLGPPPLSGIRGYAVAIDSSPDTAPCSAVDRCSAVETTLWSGATGALSIRALPEGTSHLHAIAVSGSGMKSPAGIHRPLRVDLTDPVTQLHGVPLGWVNHPVRLTASAADAGAGMEPGIPGFRPFTAIRVDGGPATVSPGATTATTVIGDGAHTIAYYARDAAGNVDDGGKENGLANRPPGGTVVRIDYGTPGVAFANAQDPRDPDMIRARVTDPLSGPDLSRGWIGVRRAGSGDRFEPLPPAPPAAGELRARWDSDGYPTGDYEFSALGFDAAGNSTTATRRANGKAMVLSNPLKATTALRAAFAARARARTVPYGRGVRLSGRLSVGVGTPLAGMPVRIVERFDPGSTTATRVSTAKTEPGGTFAIRLAPGPSREIEAGFGGSPTLGRATGGPLSLRVRGRVRLRASAAVATIGGAPLVFDGRVVAPSGEIPPDGKSVQLQFRLPGLRWTEFRTLQTDRRGRFHYAYRFSDDDSRGARFQFRAFAPAQANWPYEPAGSQPVLVRGM